MTPEAYPYTQPSLDHWDLTSLGAVARTGRHGRYHLPSAERWM